MCCLSTLEAREKKQTSLYRAIQAISLDGHAFPCTLHALEPPGYWRRQAAHSWKGRSPKERAFIHGSGMFKVLSFSSDKPEEMTHPLEILAGLYAPRTRAERGESWPKGWNRPPFEKIAWKQT